MRAITLHELHGISEDEIAQLPGVVPVESEGRTVALLMPMKPASRDAREAFREELQRVLSSRLPIEQAALDRDFGP